MSAQLCRNDNHNASFAFKFCIFFFSWLHSNSETRQTYYPSNAIFLIQQEDYASFVRVSLIRPFAKKTSLSNTRLKWRVQQVSDCNSHKQMVTWKLLFIYRRYVRQCVFHRWWTTILLFRRKKRFVICFKCIVLTILVYTRVSIRDHCHIYQSGFNDILVFF